MINRNNVVIQKALINLSYPTAARIWMIFSVAALAALQSSLSDRGTSLILALCCLCSCLLAELLITGRKHGFSKLKDGSAAVTGMVFCLLLPNQIHPLYAVAGSLFAIAVVKHSFGGLGSNWLNPALGGWLFVRLAWPGAFDSALAGSPLSIIAANLSGGAVHDAPMNMLRMSGAVSAAGSTLDAAVTSFFNNTVFLLASAELPAGYVDLLFSRAPGIIADRGLAALLAGSIVIIAFKISYNWAAAVFLAVFSFLAWYAGGLPFEGLLWNGDVLFALLSGGTLVTAFILAADPASGAKSKPGILFTAVLAAFLSWVFRFRSLEVYGCFTAIALVNVLGPAIRFFESKLFFSYKRKNARAGESPGQTSSAASREVSA